MHRDLNFFLSRNAYVAASSTSTKKSAGSVSLADQFIFAVSLNKSYIRTSEKQIITRILRDTKY